MKHQGITRIIKNRRLETVHACSKCCAHPFWGWGKDISQDKWTFGVGLKNRQVDQHSQQVSFPRDNKLLTKCKGNPSNPGCFAVYLLIFVWNIAQYWLDILQLLFFFPHMTIFWSVVALLRGLDILTYIQIFCKYFVDFDNLCAAVLQHIFFCMTIIPLLATW